MEITPEAVTPDLPAPLPAEATVHPATAHPVIIPVRVTAPPAGAVPAAVAAVVAAVAVLPAAEAIREAAVVAEGKIVS